jgi:hypothetical protein
MSMLKSTFIGTRKRCAVLASAVAITVLLALASGEPTSAKDDDEQDRDESKIKIGFEIAPVELNLKGKNPALVGLGSYIVNAQSGCSGCHTAPPHVEGGNPFLGEPEEINVEGYLAGGQFFGPFRSRNLTPRRDTGLPAGMTFEQFEFVLRTGIDRRQRPPHVPSEDEDLLQIMPWPVFGKMTERDLRAIYEYLSAIPSVP